jgi:hypothetical protein
MQFDGRPEDRDTYAVYILDIEIDHKAGGDGNMVAYERIRLGKKASPNWQMEVDVRRLEKDDPGLYRYLLPTIEGWRKTQTIATDGHPVEAWPALTKGQIKTLKGLGLRSVEDIATATDVARERYGMGFVDMQKQARAYLDNKSKTATAKQLADQDNVLVALKEQLAEAQATIKMLAAKAGMTEQRPDMKAREVA